VVLLPPALSNIPEYQHGPDNAIVLISKGTGAIIDRSFCSIFGYETSAMIR
jgi:hypothetical protein